MPGRSRSATPCSSAPAPIPRCCLHRVRLAADRRRAARRRRQPGAGLVIGLPTFRLRGHYFSMATIAVAELIRILVGNWQLVGAAVGLMGPAVPRSVADLSFLSPLPYFYMFLAVLAVLLCLTWLMQRSRMGFYLRAIRGGERAALSLGVPVLRYKLVRAAAFGGVHLARRLALCHDGRLRRSGERARHPDLREDGDHRRARRRRHAVRPAARRGDPDAAAGDHQRRVRRRRHRPDLHRLRRDHPADRALPAGRPARDAGTARRAEARRRAA